MPRQCVFNATESDCARFKAALLGLDYLLLEGSLLTRAECP